MYFQNIYFSIVILYYKNVKVLMFVDKFIGLLYYKRMIFKDKLCIFYDIKIILSNNFEILGSLFVCYFCK